MKTETKVDIADCQDEEIWKDIEGYNSNYRVSSIGRILSASRFVKHNFCGQIALLEKIMKPSVNNKGYPMIFLSLNGKINGYPIHRLVAQAFIPNPENKPQVNHKNGIKSDNRVENLEWATQSENQLHANVSGLRISIKGSKHANSKLSEEQVLKIISMKGVLHREIAEMFDVNRSTVTDIISRKRWKHI